MKGVKKMKANKQSEWKEVLICYLVIFLILGLYVAVFLISGKITGMDWISYVCHLDIDVNVDLLRQLFLLD